MAAQDLNPVPLPPQDMDRLRAELQRAAMKAAEAAEAADLLRRIEATMARVEAMLDRMAEDRRPRA